MGTLRPYLLAMILSAPACAPGTRPEAPVPSPRLMAARPKEPTSLHKPVARRPGAAKALVKAPGKVTAKAARTPSRAASVDSTALELAVTTRHAHLALARALARRTRNPAVAERAAWAVTREAGQLKVSPSLLAAVLLVENRALDSSAVSSAGAVGLMQVMPIHAGSYGCASADLRTVDANICHGARILHTYLVRTRSVPRALRRYNGCVSGTVTPGCQRYPLRVLRTAARIRREILSETRAM